MCFIMKMIWLPLFIYQIKNLKIAWIYSSYQIKVSHIMPISKILTDLYETKQKNKNKKQFCRYFYSVLVVKKPCKSIKKLVWKEMANKV